MFQSILSFLLCIWQCLMGWLGLPRAILRDFAYAAQSEHQKMDIYLPWIKGEADVILFIHGGGWWAGDKDGYDGICKEYAAKGYATATINYRLIDGSPPEEQLVSYVDMLDDIDAAIAALKAKMIERGYTPRKMAITGGSAGGHLTLLYGYSRQEQSAIPIAFLFPDVGPSDFTDPGYLDIPNGQAIVDQGYRLTGSSTSDLKAPSPIFYVEPGVPPTLMRYGALDDLVPPSNGTRLKDALNAAGVRNDLFIYPNSGHTLENPSKQLEKAYQAKLDEYLHTCF